MINFYLPLQLVALLSPSVTSYDMPVYLPHSSPNIPHRFLVFTLVAQGGREGKKAVRACVLCGPKPSLASVKDTLVERYVVIDKDRFVFHSVW